MINAVFAIFIISLTGMAEETAPLAAPSGNLNDDIISKVIQKVSAQFPETRVEVKGDLEWTSQPVLRAEYEAVGHIHFEREGIAKVEILGKDQNGGFKTTAKLSLAAYASILKTERRVLPGEILTEKNTVIDEIDFALPENKSFKGQIVHPEKSEFASFQGRFRAKQTLLPGQPIPTYAIEKIPDMERGQKLRLSIISNGLKLDTTGTAMEPGHIGALIKVLSDKNKREFSARIKSATEAEVEL